MLNSPLDFSPDLLCEEAVSLIERIESLPAKILPKLDRSMMLLINEASIASAQKKSKDTGNADYEIDEFCNYSDHDCRTPDVTSICDDDHGMIKDESTIIAAWNELQTTKDRQTFILEMKSEESLLIISKKIIYPLLQSDETIAAVVEILREVMQRLPPHAVNHIFLPLFKEKGSELTEGAFKPYLNNLMSSLSDFQRNYLLCSFLENSSGEIEEYEMIKIYLLVENTKLTDETTEILLQRFLSQMNRINHNDRYFSNTLLLISQGFTANSSKTTINFMLSLCKQFKGVLRFRIQNILKSI